ncbi:MAG: ABC transporter permease [Clostridiaceae bacterium]|nr:ABC transporter permease [Clostridiaceae bacterium]
MRNIAVLVGLKLRLLSRRPLMLVFCLIIPVLLSLLAGATVKRNDLSNIQGAYVDLAENAESRKLTELFEHSQLGWIPIQEDEINRAIELGQLDGVVIIPSRFGDKSAAVHIDDVYTCEFISGKNQLAGDLIRENYLISVLALATDAKMQKDLLSLEGAKSVSDEEMNRRFSKSADQARSEGAILRLVIRDDEMGQALPLIQVPDVAVEVLFLSVFSLLGSLMLADAATQRRMRSLPGGLRRDYFATLLALAVSGFAQLGLMVGITRLLMPSTTRPANYLPVMTVLLVLMLAFGQLVALIPGDRRFVPASLLLFISVLAGGTLLRLPAFWVERVGQYTPHGWALAKLMGMETTFSTPLVALAALSLLVLAYQLQSRSDYLSG